LRSGLPFRALLGKPHSDAPSLALSMAETVNPKRVRAGKKGAKVANRWRSGDREKASRMSSKVARKIPRSVRSRAAKKAAKTRKRA